MKPDLLDRLSGLNADLTVCSVRLCLTDSGSPKNVTNDDLARVFGQVLLKLAGQHCINLLFPYDVGEISRKLESLNIEWTREGRALIIRISASQFPILFEILRTAAFTTFYAWPNGIKPIPSDPSLLLGNLDAIPFAAVFTLYDDSLELMSKLVPAEEILKAVRGVGADAGALVS